MEINNPGETRYVRQLLKVEWQSPESMIITVDDVPVALYDTRSLRGGPDAELWRTARLLRMLAVRLRLDHAEDRSRA